ncbi:MAG: PP2C family protein-serine/threonine phosphatase, partial [Planctomycetaceae bacterium]
MPLGVLPEQEFQEVTVKLEPGDSMTIFTDGITEAMDSKHNLYGTERLARFIADGPQSSEQIVKAIVNEVDRFSGGNARDDMCLVSFRRLP